MIFYLIKKVALHYFHQVSL